MKLFLPILLLLIFIQADQIEPPKLPLPPKNISEEYEGKWKRVAGDLYGSARPQGDIVFSSLSTSTIKPVTIIQKDKRVILHFPDVQFVEGQITFRDGKWMNDPHHRFRIQGIYSSKDGHFHAFLIPPGKLFSPKYRALRAANPFNETHYNFILDIAINQKDQRHNLRKLAKELQSRDKKKENFYKLYAVVKEQHKLVTLDDDDESQTLVKEIVMNGEIDCLNCNNSMTFELHKFPAEQIYDRARKYTLLVSFVSIIQTVTLVFQMRYTRTQSGASRVSLLTIGAQGMLDSYICLIHLTIGIMTEAVFTAYSTAAFLKFVIFAVFEMRYMLQIWKARRPQAFSEWTSMRNELQSLYTRFYGLLLIGMFVIYHLTFLFVYIVFIMYSFWIPQIYCNATRNSRKSLHPLYVTVISFTRLLLPLYLFGCPYNFLHIRPNYVLCLALTVYVFAQATILLLQHFFGPRFFIPSWMLPPKYEYRRPIPPEMLENGECGTCVICMSENSREDYLITPCNHMFHSQCLTRWMEEKMECPTCRKKIPEL